LHAWHLFFIIFFPWIWLVSHFYKPTLNMNRCFLLENPEQTPLAGGTRVGVAHLVVQRPGVLPCWWAQGALSFIAQPRVISTRYVAHVRWLLYQGPWCHLGDGGDTEEDRQTQRRTDNNDQFVILAIVGVAFVLACL
jgi:hypothetical protein